MRGIHGASIRWDDPLSRGLLGIIVPGDSQSVMELVSGRRIDGTPSTSAFNFAPTPFGRGCLANSGLTPTYVPFIKTVPDNEMWSAMVAGGVRLGGVADRYSFSFGNDAGAVSANCGQNTAFRVRFINTSSSGANAVSTRTPIDGEAFVLTIHHDGLNPYFFYNGGKGATNTRQRGLGGFGFCINSSFAAEFFPAIVVGWFGKLPDSAHDQFRADPLRLLRPRVWPGVNLPAGGGAIAGDSAISIACTGTLTAKGSLSSAAQIDVTASGQLTGKGALAGATTITILADGALTGLGGGAMAGAATISIDCSGSLTAKGSLAGSTAIDIAPAGTLQGRGSLAATAALAISCDGALTADGALAGSTTIDVAPAGVLTARGALSATATITFTLSATASGTEPAAVNIWTAARREKQWRAERRETEWEALPS